MSLLILLAVGFVVVCFLLVWGMCVAAGNADRLAEQCRADTAARADERRAASGLRVQNNVTAFPRERPRIVDLPDRDDAAWDPRPRPE